MAVVNLTATARSPFTLSGTLRQVPTGPGLNVFSSTVEVGSSDSATSTYLMARLPADARIHPSSLVGWDDLASTGAPTLDIGTFNMGGSIADDDDAINDGLDAATATTGTHILKDVADYGKTLWEIAGGSSNPGGWVDIYITLKDAAVNVGGTLSMSIVYSVD